MCIFIVQCLKWIFWDLEGRPFSCSSIVSILVLFCFEPLYQGCSIQIFFSLFALLSSSLSN